VFSFLEIRNLFQANKRKDLNKMSQDDIKLSKTLSWLLRHGAKESNVEMDKRGFVSIADILKLPSFRGVTLANIERIVKDNSKQRFAIENIDGQMKIRANQGHTLDVEELSRKLIEISQQKYNKHVLSRSTTDNIRQLSN
jgi:RNA:NAD 2'-phosphotransferase (TPT1/KptA family)